MSDSGSEFEGANEYTGLMDGHVAAEVVPESSSEKSTKRKKRSDHKRNEKNEQVSS